MSTRSMVTSLFQGVKHRADGLIRLPFHRGSIARPGADMYLSGLSFPPFGYNRTGALLGHAERFVRIFKRRPGLVEDVPPLNRPPIERTGFAGPTC